MARSWLAAWMLLWLLPAAASAAGKIIEIGGGGGGLAPSSLGGDPCSRFACREFTFEDRTTLGRPLSKLMGAVPTPAPARYEQTGLTSLQGLGPTLVGDDTWQSSSFPANVIDAMALGYKDGAFPRVLSLVYSFSIKSEKERKELGITERSHAGDDGQMEIYDLRTQLTAYPTPFVASALLKGGRLVEKTLDTLIYEGAASEPGIKQLTLVVGARSDKAADMDPQPGEPTRKIAAIKAVRLDLRGPKDDVMALAKKLDRRALAALVAPFANHDLPKKKDAKDKGNGKGAP